MSATTVSLPSISMRSHALKMALASGENLDDCRLLEGILSYHFGEKDAAVLANDLLVRFEHLGNVLHSDLDSLLEVNGVTLQLAAAILHFRHLTRALGRAEIRHRKLLNNEEMVRRYCRSLLAHAESEEFHALFLNRRGELLLDDCLQQGTIDHVCVYPREILKRAVSENASFVILAHSHPVGEAKPSEADVAMTNHLADLCTAIGVIVHDHIIVSGSHTFSFRENGLM